VRLVRDRDAIFGAAFDARVDNPCIRQWRIAARSPWRNGFAERWIGTLRRELLDHVIVLGEEHVNGLVSVGEDRSCSLDSSSAARLA